MISVNAILKTEMRDINKEDLADELTAYADRIREGVCSTLAVTVVSKEDNTIQVQQMFVGTNPYREDPASGSLLKATITGLEGDTLTETFNHYLNSIDVTLSNENSLSTQPTLAIGELGGEGSRFIEFSGVNHG